MAKRLTRDDCILVAIDYQEKLVPAMYEKESLIQKTERLVRGFGILSLPVLFTQQYTKGLGETIEEIRQAAGEEAVYIDKLTFSAWGDENFVTEFKKRRRNTAVVVGIEAHVCEQQTVLDLLEEGYTVYVAADCVSSRSAFDRDVALKRMGEAGAVITTYESILFELVGWCKAEEFKQISKLVK